MSGINRRSFVSGSAAIAIYDLMPITSAVALENQNFMQGEQRSADKALSLLERSIGKRLKLQTKEGEFFTVKLSSLHRTAYKDERPAHLRQEEVQLVFELKQPVDHFEDQCVQVKGAGPITQTLFVQSYERGANQVTRLEALIA